MTAKNRNFILLLLLIVIVVGIFLTKSEIGKEYSQWFKTVFLSKINIFQAGISPALDKDSGIDISEINLDNLLTENKIQEPEKSEVEQERLVVEKILETEFAPEPKPITLEEVEEQLNNIIKETERIERDIQKLKTLVEIEEEIQELASRIADLSKEVEELA